MSSLRRPASKLAAPTAIVIAALFTAAAPAAASSGWQLTDQYTARPACYTTTGGTEYLELNLNGSWSTSISMGASALPTGVSTAGTALITFTNGVVSGQTDNVPIPPGSSNGTGPITTSPTTYVEGYVLITVAGGQPANSSFDITLSANDGTTTQTESVPVDIKTSCRNY
jgi:hypothetical protein